ncbi:hypothetical protein NIIDNTM18_46440 [Mycolicibacterium litorale]|uniref:Cullin, a subunit of E3 ubiquitin ligase n=1 Tax=Mycolicibacterium litorale TaxID=758802 RepID=A0A6S6PBK7_9MYCO|nr:type IV toxin-antitoxin system AbiEi family antitoxin [Mycolicibacterium litorale]BCI55366.1 hypothetical protein NIIDNTM18_46440 [Mycolicibacterium litorale]
MGEPFIGSEAIASGALTPYALRSRFRAIYPDVYVPPDLEVTATQRAEAAWLWTHRQGVVAGRSAAAMHGARWVDASKPAEVLWPNRRPPPGLRTWSDRVGDDEVEMVDGVRVTTPARTALDIAARYPFGRAVAAIDALARATHLKVPDVELLAERYRGRRGIRNAHNALGLVDPGAESPRETWLRLLVVRNGFPAPQTQIPVYDGYGQLVAVVDMGWQDIKVALDYEGSHHLGPDRFNKDIHRHEAITELGWIDIRVTSRDTEGGIIARLRSAWRQRA